MEILVDSSVWIDFFNGVKGRESAALHKLLEAESPLCICDIVLTEVLQGFRKDNEFELAKKHLLQFPVYTLASPDGYVRAAELYRKCKKKGLTVKTVDCLIAQTATDHGLTLFHKDNDFNRISGVSNLGTVRP